MKEELSQILANFTTRLYLEGGNNANEITDQALTSIINLVDKELPEKVKEYPIKIVDRDNPNNVWASSMTHGLNDRDSGFNAAIDVMRAKLKGVSNVY